MIESTTLPLAPRLNATNTSDSSAKQNATTKKFDHGFALHETPSVTKMLEELAQLNLGDENIPPTKLFPITANHNINKKHIETSTDVDILKSELETTRRKLAEYEARSNAPMPTKYNSQSRHSSTSLEFPQNDDSPWSDYGSTSSLPPPPPHPSPHHFPSSVPPLQLPPSATLPFYQQNAGVSNTVNPLRLRNDRRNFTQPIPAPISEPRRMANPQRNVSSEYKAERDPWGTESEWSGWPVTSPPHQLTGTASLGVVYNDQSQWTENIMGASHLQTPEQVDWRRLLDRSMSCNWHTVIEKVICNSDQQASLFLQQKLKLATPVQKLEIIDAIVAQCYPLMVNRFGNFLVQRCFEYGTKEQIDGIANTIRGNVVALSMDMFGCHVIQKAFDCVDEDYKAAMVKELLCRIQETVGHRFACHVWQKLLEIRWEGAAPVIMKYVNDALVGHWTEIALGETGSLVVQNIFENCLDEDKRPCINEILDNVDTIARGQWGNWVIQHIVEHGHPEDRVCALDVILNHASNYSTDQFASKVIEKALKCCGQEIFQRYVAKVVEKQPGRPRVALIDISSDIYGNYLIQYILQNGPQNVREQIACHVRKHMVSLRGSRYGQRVAFQVERMRITQQTSNWQGRWE